MAIQDIYNAVIEYNKDKAAQFVKAEIDSRTDILTILNEGLIAPLDVVGKRFSAGEIFVPEMLMASLAMKTGLEVLRPLLRAVESKPKGTIVIGTVKGDQHDIGKNLVVMMLEGAGFEVIDLGVDVSTEKFIAAAQQNGADVVALSALLTTTMPAMEAIVTTIKENGLALKTMVGGAPVTEAFANKIGADGYSEDAPGAVELVRKFLAC
jgi:5-methyltetrahydrofolate--homocysteine methyltransferase